MNATQTTNQASPVVYGDETGWRGHRMNSCAWTFCAPTARFFARRSSTKEVGDEVPGATIAGVLVSDGYAASHHNAGSRRRCWAQLLCDVHDIAELHPSGISLTTWATETRIVDGEAMANAHADESLRPRIALVSRRSGQISSPCK